MYECVCVCVCVYIYIPTPLSPGILTIVIYLLLKCSIQVQFLVSFSLLMAYSKVNSMNYDRQNTFHAN
jgi:hypothetical protein